MLHRFACAIGVFINKNNNKIMMDHPSAMKGKEKVRV
jgi:hypothetical protein